MIPWKCRPTHSSAPKVAVEPDWLVGWMTCPAGSRWLECHSGDIWKLAAHSIWGRPFRPFRCHSLFPWCHIFLVAAATLAWSNKTLSWPTFWPTVHGAVVQFGLLTNVFCKYNGKWKHNNWLFLMTVKHWIWSISWPVNVPQYGLKKWKKNVLFSRWYFVFD